MTGVTKREGEEEGGIQACEEGVFPESIEVSGKLPSYPSPKPTLTPTAHLKQNVGLGEG